MKAYRGIQIKRAEIGFGLGFAVAFRIDNGDIEHTSGSLSKTKERIDFALDIMGATIVDDTLVLTAEQVEQHAAGEVTNLGWFIAPVRIVERDAHIAEQEAAHAAALAAGEIVVGQTVQIRSYRKSKKHLNGLIGPVTFVSKSVGYSGMEAWVKIRGVAERVIVEELVAVKAGA